ncbi:MAG: hypothetical protein J0L56_07640 [Chitinophagales bacterium]|nr:hypothetical protein [Chitinophagales bacterium]
MNRWLVTIIAGSLLAGLSWFAYDLFFAPKKETLYSATYRIRVTEDTSRKSQVTGNPVAATVQLIANRLTAAMYKHSISAVANTEEGGTLFDVRISNLDDSSRIKEWLTSRGLLQFREMYTPQEILPAINLADSILQAENAGSEEINTADTVAAISPEVKALLDSMNFSEQQELQRSKGISSLLQVSYSPAELGVVKIKDTARLGELFRRKELIYSLPSDAQYCFGKTFRGPSESGEQQLGFYFIRTRGHEKAVIENEDIASATGSFKNGKPVVTMEFTEAGTYAWGNLTENNIGKPIAMLFDNFLLTAPAPQQRLGSTSMITGDFTVNETQELALLISGAALPADVTILSAEIRKEQAPQSKKLLVSLLAFVIGAAATFFILNSLKST